jgi:hypothetical protein
VKLYHTTSGPLLEEILADGFPASIPDASGVRLTDRAPASLNGQAAVVLDIPEEEVRRYEFDELGSSAREFSVPADVLNRYPILAHHSGQRPTGPVTPAPAPAPPRRGPWIAVGAVVLLLAAGAVALLATGGDDDDEESPPPERAAEQRAPQREPEPPPPSQRPEPERPGSVAVGSAQSGRLVRGVALPSAGRNHFTWDVSSQSSPNSRSRLYGTDYVVRSVLRAARRYRAGNSGAPKVGIGDLSRRRGGELAGSPGHANGLGVVVLYPRSDRAESEPGFVEDVDRGLAQALLDELARAGATRVTLDPRLGLRVPRRVTRSTSIEPRMDVVFRKRP